MVKQGDICNEVILVFKLPSTRKVQLYKDNYATSNIKAGMWLGTIEYLTYLGVLDEYRQVKDDGKSWGNSQSSYTGMRYERTHLNSRFKNAVKKPSKKVRWGIDAIVEEIEVVGKQVSSEDDTEDKDDVIFYKWDFK